MAVRDEYRQTELRIRLGWTKRPKSKAFILTSSPTPFVPLLDREKMAFNPMKPLKLLLDKYLCLRHSVKFHVSAFHECLKLPRKTPDIAGTLNKAAFVLASKTGTPCPRFVCQVSGIKRKKVKVSAASWKKDRRKAEHSKSSIYPVSLRSKQLCVSDLSSSLQTGQTKLLKDSSSTEIRLIKSFITQIMNFRVKVM